jgi:hypothetical protein
LGRIFAERKQTGAMDLEALEMGFRASLHQAGAAALTQLLQFPEPAAEQRNSPCPCGQYAHYRELRSRRLLTALGEVELSRAPGIYVRTVTTASSPSIANSISKTATSRPGCDACRP